MTAISTCRPLRILSLDGGGIRGIASLFVLQDIMLRIKLQETLAETPRPCDWFDLIVGTSTGGIIALILGRLKMSVDDAIDAYKVLAEEAFGAETRSWLRRASLLSSEPRYSAEKLEDAVRKIAGDAKLADPEGEPVCRVATVAVQLHPADRYPDLFRTYNTELAPYSCTIVEAARATLAVTTFFPPADIQIRPGLQVRYLDGLLGYNNPTDLAVQEAEDLWGPDPKFGCIVSIGSGMSPNVRFEGSKLSLDRKLWDISAGCQRVHVSMDRRFGGMRKRMYFRFDPSDDVGGIALQAWENFDQVSNLVHAYLNEVQVHSRDCTAAITHPVCRWLLSGPPIGLAVISSADWVKVIQDFIAPRPSRQAVNQEGKE